MSENESSASDRELGPHNAAYAERMQRRFRANGRAVPADWRRLFEGPLAEPARPAMDGRDRPLARSIFDPAPAAGADSEELLALRVESLAQAFFAYGHEAAAVNPLVPPPAPPLELDPAFHGLAGADLERGVVYRFGPLAARRTVRSVLRHLRESFCRKIAVDVDHVRNRETRAWLRSRMETERDRERPAPDARRALLGRLLDAHVFETIVRKRFVGAKSYSLAGSEVLLALLDAAIETAARQGIDEIVMAMAHRGRLNVLANLFDVPPCELFYELADTHCEPGERGDVRHHLGASADVQAGGRNVHVSLCFNPSHLEFVDPIALGRVRAKQDQKGDRARLRAMAILVHGDAAFAGEGVVQETLNLEGLAGYDTGGALHVVLDNQVGFTTPPSQGRSFRYATDVARMTDMPILHVAGDDPEAAVRAAAIALDYRREFRRGVVLRLVCFRRYGHNELDEPRITQPLLYQRIDRTPPVADAYRDRLIADGVVDAKEAAAMLEERRARLSDELERADGVEKRAARAPAGVWSGYRGGPASNRDEVHTAVDRARLAELLEQASRVRAGFHPHEKAERALAARRAMARGERPLDWAAAEILAFATLSADGVPVRLSGQDTVRGTFSQRHAAHVDRLSGEIYEPLRALGSRAAAIEVVNSPLSECGALGFEYGYSLDRPGALVLWEAQYGDFVNAAQVVIDQFLASAEDKWNRLSGLVLLLPHGFEGQGPEHSSARMERFLTSAAEDNLQIVQPSTPAQLFHVLRRQALQRWRKPLVLFTPKGILRHRSAVSELEECARGAFEPVLGALARGAKRVLLCSGRVFYALAAEAERQKADVAILRVEELYPFPSTALRDALAPLEDGARVTWVQDEPENMGAWRYFRALFAEDAGARFALEGVCRPASASPAGGSSEAHRREEEELLQRAIRGASHDR